MTAPVAGLRLGVDVGGTNTDAVLVDEAGRVLSSHKARTTPDPFDGIRAALEGVLTGAPEGAGQVMKAMLGTTHPANAIIQRRELQPVGVLRLALPSSSAVLPAADWPADLRAAVVGPVELVRGGFQFDGSEIAPLDEDAVRRAAGAWAGRVGAVAVSSAFAPANREHELRAAEILTEELGSQVVLSLSHRIGSLGLLERENATVLNASLHEVGRRVVDGFRAALDAHGIEAPAFLTQNDGTLIAAEEAVRTPILTVGSGPTNSMRGACALAGLQDALVIDVGGTSADVGILVGGFPRSSAAAVEVGGVRTNFRMPDLLSIGLGGGTVVRPGDAGVRVGPDSVGYLVAEAARVRGGDTLTLSDISTLAGRLTGFGDAALAADVPDEVVAAALAWVDAQVLVLCERMRASRLQLPLIAVGGGSHLVSASQGGVTEVVFPEHHAVANAYGAAIAEVSGSVDRVYQFDGVGREACLQEARELAVAEAVRGGADAAAVRITSVDEIPLAYVPGQARRVMVRAVGPLRS